MKFLRDITEFIFLEDLPKKADIIIVPGNTWPQPARRAAALYQAGMAPYIVVSGKYSKGRSAFEGPSCDRECYKGPYAAEADFLTDVLMQAGVLREAILQEREATFTLENAEDAGGKAPSDKKGHYLLPGFSCQKMQNVF